MRQLWAITWKEWLGLRWKLAALLAVLVGTILGLLLVDAELIPTSIVTLFIAYSALAPIFLAMHAAAEDNSAGTLEFVRGIPVPLFQFGMIRILATLAVLLVPLAAAGITVLALNIISASWLLGGRVEAIGNTMTIFSDIVVVTAVAMAASASLYLWTTALAMNQSSELRAGLIGVLIAIAWAVCMLFSLVNIHNQTVNWTWRYAVSALGPFASLVMLDPRLSTAGWFAMALGHFAGMCALVVVAARRYGILERRRPTNCLRPATPGGALWWMQWRQVWPLAVSLPGIVFAYFVVGMAMQTGDVTVFRSLVYTASTLLGSAWAIVVGTATFCAELEPKLVSFWRSRPIDPADWFRTKYVTGSLSLLLFVELPAAWIGKLLEASETASFLGYMACVPALHLAVYSLSVLIACLVRHTIYAGILSMGAATVITVLPRVAADRSFLSALSSVEVMRDIVLAGADGQTPYRPAALAIYLTFTLTVAAAATLAARWAIQKDIAVRQSATVGQVFQPARTSSQNVAC